MKYPGFIGKSYQAAPESFEADETVNLTLEYTGPKSAIYRKAPGLSIADPATFISQASIAVGNRGMFWLNGTIFSVLGDTIYWAKAASQTSGSLGPIANDNQPVTFAASRTQLVICSAKIPYLIILATPSLSGAITWPGVDIAAVAYCNTYFLFLAEAGNGFYYSEPGDANSGTAINLAVEETHASKFHMILVVNNQPWLFGDLFIQPFFQTQDTANPFLPNLSAAIPVGSTAKFGPIDIRGTICWIGQSDEGGASAYRASGYSAQRISPQGIDSRWSSGLSLSGARSWSLEWQGHLCWRVWFPASNETWQYDLTTDDWTRVASWDLVDGKFTAHLGCASVFDADSGRVLMGSRVDGSVYVISPSYVDDDGVQMHWKRKAPAIINEDKLTGYPAFELVVNSGAGDGTAASSTNSDRDPLIGLRYSKNGGNDWSATINRTMGQMGAYLTRLRWMGLGTHRRFQIEVSGEASVPLAIHDALLEEPKVLQS
jgi:hypothetical protein